MDPSVNPNADPERRRALIPPLQRDLLDVVRRHVKPIAAVSEDVPTFFRSLMAAYFVAILVIQAETEADTSLTVKDHMTNQFAATKAAYSTLAERNKSRWNKPVSDGEARDAG